jgi:hypothetical protein
MAYNEALAARIRRLLEGTKGLEEKKMFGGVGFLVEGNMACGVYKDELILRLGESEGAAALRAPHVRIFDITGRPMKGWVLVAEQGYRSDKALQDRIAASMAFARSLPRK